MTDDPTELGDLDLVEQARQGDQGAVVDLWTRYYPVALSVARRSSRQPRDAEEIASDAFAGMLSAIAGGAGPTGSVRAYLATSVRNIATSRARRGSAREISTDDDYVLDAAQVDLGRDPVAEFVELGIVREAFAELPHRWQVVLWRTAVDHDSNIVVGREMGLSPNGVAALARRAKRGLRIAYVRAHVSSRGVEPSCEPFIEHLADFADPLAREGSGVEAHVASCTNCAERVSELRLVDRRMASVLGPAILGLMPANLLEAAGRAAGSAVAAPAAHAMHTGRWAAASIGAVGAAAVALWVLHDPPSPAVVEPPPASTKALPSSSTSPPVTRSPTVTRRTTRPAVPRATQPSRPASPIPSPRPPARSVPVPPRSTRSPAVPATPLVLSLALGGTRTDMSVSLKAQVQGIGGSLTLTLQVPAGVTLARSVGDWVQCSQSGTVITCTADAQSSGQWAGTLHTIWADEAGGRVTATVSGRYANGSPARGSVGATWPP